MIAEDPHEPENALTAHILECFTFRLFFILAFKACREHFFGD